MKTKVGLVTFKCALIVIGTGDRDTTIIADAKEKVKEGLKGVPFLMVNLLGEPRSLVTAQKQKKHKSRKRKNDHGKGKGSR